MTGGPRPPAAEGVRPGWEEVPGRVRAAIEAWPGDKVVAAGSSAGGFSPGLAARLRTRDGRQVFVKAVGPKPNPGSPAVHRREIEVVRMLPPEAPAPRRRVCPPCRRSRPPRARGGATVAGPQDGVGVTRETRSPGFS